MTTEESKYLKIGQLVEHEPTGCRGQYQKIESDKWIDVSVSQNMHVTWPVADCRVVEPLRWVPVEERLPRPVSNRVVLVTVAYQDGLRAVCRAMPLKGGDFMVFGHDNDGEIVAWMPLPKPYKEA